MPTLEAVVILQRTITPGLECIGVKMPGHLGMPKRMSLVGKSRQFQLACHYIINEGRIGSDNSPVLACQLLAPLTKEIRHRKLPWGHLLTARHSTELS